MEFTFRTSVFNQTAVFNITDPTRVVDKYNWTLVGPVNPAKTRLL